ncbi:MAG: penicillin-binding protein 2 [Syntrophobacteraceae bacterium]|nr:penicillin-binding protein 2 [Syntrophobacteraceae bacterium]
MKTKGRKLDGPKLINLENAESVSFKKQYIVFFAVLLLVMMIYLARLWYLQALCGQYYRYQSENNRIRVEDVEAPRGIIFDRNGVPIVENRPAYDLMIVREDVKDLNGTIEELARLCECDPSDLFSIVDANKATPKFVPIRLVSDIDRDCLARVAAELIRLPGVEIEIAPKREYNWDGTAAHLIGYLSQITEGEMKSGKYPGYYPGEDIGKVGVEYGFEKYLHGVRGHRQVEVDAVGRRVRLLQEQPPVAGHDLWLTIDMDAQRTAESLLADKSGAIVAVDPNDGEVLAFASSPTFNQEKFIKGLSESDWMGLSKDPGHPMLNRVSGAAYAPGSTYKPLVALGALQAGAINPTTTFSCPGYMPFAGREYHCWRKGGHGTISVERALMQSCDVFFYHTGLVMGVDRLAEYVKMFGLGQKTGIDLPGENAGLIPTSAWKRRATGHPWEKGETISISIGQGYDLVTPLQMAVAYGAIANSGKLWTPYVVKRIEGMAPGEVKEAEPMLKRQIPVDQRWFELVQKALSEVVSDPRGTAHSLYDPAMPMAGKTGTAQVVGLGRGRAGQNDKDNAWFVAWAPAADPKICVAAIIEHGGHGGSAAGPLVKQVMMTYLKIKHEPAQKPAHK